MAVWRLRDSVIATQPAPQVDDASVYFIQDPRVPDWLTARVRSTAESEILPYRQSHSARTIVAMTADTSLRTGAFRLLPHNTDGRVCLVLFNFDDPWLTATESDLDRWRLRVFNGGVLGPCAVVQAVGVPSETIKDWVSGSFRNYASVATPTPLNPPLLDRDANPYGGVLYLYSGPALSCVKRGRDCDLFHGSRPTNGLPPLPDRLWRHQYNEILDLRSNYRTVGAWSQRHQFGGYERRLLHDMALDLGPDRFTVFWQSPLEPAAAFEAAAGEPPDAWIARWASRLGPVPRQMTPMRGSSLWGSVVVVGVLFGLGVAVATRRQVH